MKLPDSIKIGPHFYTVDTDQASIHAESFKEGQPLDGHIIHDQLKITISDDNAGTYRADVLLHEVLHGVIVAIARKEQIGIEEESFVRALSTALLAVMRDNPEFVNFLMADG